MSEEFDVSLNLTTEVCINCGVVFTLPCTLRERLLESHDSFYCPNGHAQQFTGKTKDEEIAKLENRVKYYKNKANKAKEKSGK